jgi:hypothetical protein
MPQIIIAVSSLLASFAGYSLAGRNERRRDERERQAAAVSKHAERLAESDRISHEFQLETMLALQDEVQKMARAAGRALHFDHMQARQGRYTQLPPEWSDEMHANGVAVSRLNSRVLDQSVRSGVEAFVAAATSLPLSPRDLVGLHGDDLESAASQKFAALAHSARGVQELLGAAVRLELAWQPLPREFEQGSRTT